MAGLPPKKHSFLGHPFHIACENIHSVDPNLWCLCNQNSYIINRLCLTSVCKRFSATPIQYRMRLFTCFCVPWEDAVSKLLFRAKLTECMYYAKTEPWTHGSILNKDHTQCVVGLLACFCFSPPLASLEEAVLMLQVLTVSYDISWESNGMKIVGAEIGWC